MSHIIINSSDILCYVKPENAPKVTIKPIQIFEDLDEAAEAVQQLLVSWRELRGWDEFMGVAITFLQQDGMFRHDEAGFEPWFRDSLADIKDALVCAIDVAHLKLNGKLYTQYLPSLTMGCQSERLDQIKAYGKIRDKCLSDFPYSEDPDYLRGIYGRFTPLLKFDDKFCIVDQETLTTIASHYSSNIISVDEPALEGPGLSAIELPEDPNKVCDILCALPQSQHRNAIKQLSGEDFNIEQLHRIAKAWAVHLFSSEEKQWLAILEDIKVKHYTAKRLEIEKALEGRKNFVPTEEDIKTSCFN